MKPQLIDITFKDTIQIKKVDKFYLDNPFHFHHLCELVWIEKSFGKRVVGDNVDNFSDGDLVLMSPNLPHIWQNDSIFFRKKKGYRSKAIVIYFPSDFVSNLSDDPLVIRPVEELTHRASRGLRFYGLTHQKVTNILSNISNSNGLKKIIDFLNIIEILSQSKEYEYLASITFKNMYDEKDTDRINTVYKFLMSNFHREISLQEIANVSHMSPTAFCRYFKSRTQKSFTQFLNELRVGHASKLLHDKSYSISDVCYESGFNNFTNFNKFFKAITKETPSNYRRKLIL